MESANKNDVQQGTDRLANINEDGVLRVEELRAVNAMKIEGMKEFVKNNRKAPPAAPDANASLDAVQQYQGELGAYNEMKSVLDRFDTQISALKTNYEKSKDGLKEATKDELAKLEATLGIEKKADAPVAAPAAAPTTKEEPKAPAGKPEEAKDGKAADAPKADSKPAPEAAAKPESKDAPKTAEYVVKKGDNLTKIAKEHGTTVDALAKENGIENRNHIVIGQKLKVPAKAEAKPASDAEAAAAAKPAAKQEGGKDGKAADGKAEEGKTDKKTDAKTEGAPKVDPKVETPSATATLAAKPKVETAAKPAAAEAKAPDVQAPAGGTQTGAAGGRK